MSVTSFSELLAARAEGLLARWIAESSAAERLAHELEGSSFTVRVGGLPVGVTMTAEAGRIKLTLPERERAATLRATPLDLLRLLRGRGLANLRGTRADLRGSLDVAEKFAALLEHARPDLEEELARWVGDLAAHELGGVARRAAGWLGRTGRAVADDTVEYLQEESAILPTAVEARELYAEVERLRDDVERAGERLRRLAASRTRD